jgi:hypothetical protein
LAPPAPSSPVAAPSTPPVDGKTVNPSQSIGTPPSLAPPQPQVGVSTESPAAAQGTPSWAGLRIAWVRTHPRTLFVPIIAATALGLVALVVRRGRKQLGVASAAQKSAKPQPQKASAKAPKARTTRSPVKKPPRPAVASPEDLLLLGDQPQESNGTKPSSVPVSTAQPQPRERKQISHLLNVVGYLVGYGTGLFIPSPVT